MNEDFKLKSIYDKYCENKNSHVYLVETNSIEEAISDIKKLIILINKDQNNDVESLVNNNSLPTLQVIGPKLQEIVTDDIEKLVVMLQKIPVITKENYFIVYDAEKLNKKSGNQMLKVIEEPETDIIGFFVCTNSDSVMPTITSRAQIISLTYDIEKTFSEDIINDATKYLSQIHSGDSIIVNKYYVEKYKDLDSFISFINCIITEEKKYINSNLNFDIIVKENKILKMMYEILSKVRSNCNINLLLDKFLIEVSRL